jgi:serine/threonine protein kinase
VVFESCHPDDRDLRYAVKAIPRATYASREQGGYEKDFQTEVKLHRDLAVTGLMPNLTDFGSDDLRFGNHEIPCFWLEMEYIEGPTLAEKITNSPDDPREIAQIAWDLLDLIHALQLRGIFHNDLHGDNIKVKPLQDREARREAIHSRVRVVVLDPGSAADTTKSNSERLGDVHWVARHIGDLLNAYELSHEKIDPSMQRLCSQLRRVAEFYSGADRTRAPKPQDMKKAIHDAYSFGERPWNQPVRLGSISEHYNAQTLPSWFAPELLHDPKGRWAKRLMGPGPPEPVNDFETLTVGI